MTEENKIRTIIKEQRLTGERALFHTDGVKVQYCIFADGESPLKESKELIIEDTSFQWKYPLWYCNNVTVTNSDFHEMARAGIWYTNNLTMTDCLYEAPKGLRRVNHATLTRVRFLDAKETLWHCSDITLKDVTVKGDYFGMNSRNLAIDGLTLAGNYSFDGCMNITMKNARLLTKDAFWNCQNVTVEDSYICGEYFGWNSENVTLVNCTIESLQGFCYMKNVKLVNCKLLNTTLAFEYSTVDADITTEIDSVKNPLGGRIASEGIGELILEKDKVDPEKTSFIVKA